MRYLPLTPDDRSEMLARIGVADIDELFADIPADKRLKALPDLPRTKSEIEVERVLGRIAGKNVAAGSVPFFVGCGAYKHHVPASVDHLIQRSEFLTSYTPYQPEIAQGTLHYLFEFQTQVAMLTGMEVANASMYDGSTACAEAVLMAHRVTKRKKAVLAGNLHPHYRETVETVSRHVGSRGRRAAAVAAGRGRYPRGDRQGDESASSCRTRTCYGQLHDLHADRREGARGRRAADRGRHRSRVARAGQAAGRDGRRHRRRRRAIDRQRAEFRRALCRAVRDAARNTCGRCPAAWSAKRSMRKASAASC